MAYQYDPFFSYKRDRESDKWHEKVKTKLEFWLKQGLGHVRTRRGSRRVALYRYLGPRNS